MATVTLNGHKNVPAIVPTSQLSQYLPDTRLTGLRMRGPTTKKGKSLPYIPRFADARATLLDLRPEANKGCTEFFYNTPPAAPTPAPATVSSSSKPHRQQTEVFSAAETQQKSRGPENQYDTPPAGPIVASFSHPQQKTKNQQNNNDDDDDDTFSPPNHRDGLNRSPEGDHQIHQPPQNGRNPLVDMAVESSLRSDTSGGSIQELRGGSGSNQQHEQQATTLNVDPNDMIADLYRKRDGKPNLNRLIRRTHNNTGNQQNNKNEDTPVDSTISTGRRPATTNNSNKNEPFDDLSFTKNTTATSSSNKNNDSSSSSDQQKHHHSLEDDLAEGVEKAREIVKDATNLAISRANEFLQRISPQRDRSNSPPTGQQTREDASNKNKKNDNTHDKNDEDEDEVGKLINKGRQLYSTASTAAINFAIAHGVKPTRSESPHPTGTGAAAASSSSVTSNDTSNNKNNNNISSRSDNTRKAPPQVEDNSAYLGANIIGAAKEEFKKKQKYLKERLGKIMQVEAQEKDLMKKERAAQEDPDLISPAVPPSTSDSSLYHYLQKSSDDPVAFPGGRFSSTLAGAAEEEDQEQERKNAGPFALSVPPSSSSQQELRRNTQNGSQLDLAALRARTMTGFRGLVRNEDAITVGMPEGTKVEPRYTKRNEFHNYTRRGTNPYTSPEISLRNAQEEVEANNDDRAIDLIDRQNQQHQLPTSSIPVGLRSTDMYSKNRQDDDENADQQNHNEEEMQTKPTAAAAASSSPTNPLHDHVGPVKEQKSPFKNSVHEIAPDPTLTTSPQPQPNTENNTNNVVPPIKKQARISSASPEQHSDRRVVNTNNNNSKRYHNRNHHHRHHQREPSGVSSQANSSSSSSSDSDLSDELPDRDKVDEDANKNPERKSLNKKWVSDRADALRVMLFGLAVLIGICIAALERDSWMICSPRTVTRALRGVAITDSPAIIDDSTNPLISTVGTNVYVAARAGIWDSCVTVRINTSDEGRLLTRFEGNLRHALKTVRDGPQRSAESAVLNSASTPDWELGDGLSILSSVGFEKVLPVYQLCTSRLRDHAECNSSLGLTFVRVTALAVIMIVFAGLFFISIVLDLTVIRIVKVKIHKVVLAFFLIFLWALSLSVWVLYVDSANVPTTAAATHAECELEANLREALAAVAHTTIAVAENSSKYERLVAARESQNRTEWNSTENATLEAMRNNLTVVPATSLADRVMYFDDCRLGFSLYGWLGAWMFFTVIICLYLLARFSAYQAYNRAKQDANPFNPANLIRFGLHSMMPGVFGLPSTSAGSEGANTEASYSDDEYEFSGSGDDEDGYYSGDNNNHSKDDHDGYYYDEPTSSGNYNNTNEDDEEANDEIVAIRNELDRHRSTSAQNNTNNNNEPLNESSGAEQGMDRRVSSGHHVHSPTTPNRTGGGRSRFTNGPNPGHRKGRGSRGSQEDKEPGWLSQTFSTAVGVVGDILSKSFAGPSPDAEEKQRNLSRRGHRNRNSWNSENLGNTKSILKPNSTLVGSANIDEAHQEDQHQSSTGLARTYSRGGSRNVGAPPDHHRRRSSGQSSSASRGGGEKGFFSSIASMAVDKIVPFIIGMPSALQKHEAARMVRKMYPSLPPPLVNKAVDFVVDAARVLAREAHEKVHGDGDDNSDVVG